MDGNNHSNDGFFPKVKGSGPVKRAREEYEERRCKLAEEEERAKARKIRTRAASNITENVKVQNLLPPSYRLFVTAPGGEGERLQFEEYPRTQDDGEVVYVLPTITNRGLMKKFLCEFEEKGGKKRGMYVHGLQGIGKSYCLAYLVHRLRGQPDKYRVTYVHDCQLWVQDAVAWRFILKEILFTFALDTFPPDSEVHGWCAKMLRATGSEDPSGDRMVEKFFYSLVDALKDWVSSKNLLWVAVFDQVNALENWRKEKRKQELPATCSWVESAAQTVAPGVFVTVVSASATNEVVSDSATNPYKRLHRLDVGLDLAPFSDGETWYMVEKLIKNHDKVSLGDIMKDDIVHLIDRTGNMPWNVVSVFRAPGDSLRKMVDNWEQGPGGGRGYAKAVRTAHMEYRKYLGSLKQANPEVYGKSPLDQLEHCVGCAILHVPVEADDLDCMDHRYMYICREAPRTNHKGWHVPDTLFCDFCDPVARDAIAGRLEKPVTVFDLVVQPLLARPDLPSKVKGGIIEGYILERLRVEKKVDFTIHQREWVQKKKKKEEVGEKGQKEAVKIKFAKVMSIPHDSYLPKGDIPPGWICYIPESETYKGCDLVIVNKTSRKPCAYAIQITTKIESHKWTWWDNEKDDSKKGVQVPHTSPFEQWRGYLGFDPQLVWLCPCLPCVKSSSNKWCKSSSNKRFGLDKHYFILFKDLETHFKALVEYEDEDEDV